MNADVWKTASGSAPSRPKKGAALSPSSPATNASVVPSVAAGPQRNVAVSSGKTNNSSTAFREPNVAAKIHAQITSAMWTATRKNCEAFRCGATDTRTSAAAYMEYTES